METKNISIAFAMLAILLSFANCKKYNKLKKQEDTFTPNYALAKTSNELIALRNNPNNNLIKTLAQVDANIKSTPLSKLSGNDLTKFRESLVIRDGIGIVSFNYAVLEKSLSYDDFAIVIGMFGLDAKQGFWGFSKDPKVIQRLGNGSNKHVLNEGDDTDNSGDDSSAGKGYWCKDPNQCERRADAICIGC